MQYFASGLPKTTAWAHHNKNQCNNAFNANSIVSVASSNLATGSSTQRVLRCLPARRHVNFTDWSQEHERFRWFRKSLPAFPWKNRLISPKSISNRFWFCRTDQVPNRIWVSSTSSNRNLAVIRHFVRNRYRAELQRVEHATALNENCLQQSEGTPTIFVLAQCRHVTTMTPARKWRNYQRHVGGQKQFHCRNNTFDKCM